MLERAGAEISALAALVIVAVGLLVFAWIANAAGDGGPYAFDKHILLALRTPGDLSEPIGPGWFDHAMADITGLGGIIILTLIVVSIVIYLLMTGRWRNAIVVAGASVSGVLLSQVLKASFGRARPEIVPQLVEVHSLSFPSGHALQSTVIYLTLGALMARFHKRKRERTLIMLYAVLMAMLIGLSRLYLGVHWPTDVIAGWALGSAWAALWWLFAWKFLREKQETPSTVKTATAKE